MKDYEIQSIVSLLERSAKALEKSDDYRHKELAKDSDWCVRSYAARNPATPADVLTELARIATMMSAVMRQGIPTSPITKRKNFNLR